jgi:predicted O-methyltransferase YrrM
MMWCDLMRSLRTRTAAPPRSKPSMPSVPQSVIEPARPNDWYHPVMIGPSTVAEMATSSACLKQVVDVAQRLEPDDYITYLLAYYRAGMERFGQAWRYADIATVLMSAANLIRPRTYLEIGVRRGRSLAMVAAPCPDCEIYGFDLWIANYAGIPNPGSGLVKRELNRLGHKGRLELITGNSHETVPRFLTERGELFFDLMVVDGDHSRRGAEQDLRTVLPRLKVGGIIVFDDICHPLHPYLARVWNHVVGSDSRFACWQFTELGYGVAFGLMKDA